ncbi:DNA adenine methylase [Ruminococcus sp.]|jgi:site-specific DNA methylase|uniref:DNA adenine methylase n=1 Tax=Ruminococcus sp. TaxID=41978 RepID=UPI003AB8175B
MGNKTSILHILYALFPLNYERYIEPFGGSGAVLLGKKKPDKFEVYNDYNHNLVNLFRCMRDRPMAFIKELGFYPLNSRDDFNVIKNFFKQEKFEDKYLDEELELTKIILPDLKAEEIIELYIKMKQDYDLCRAVMFLKLLRYSYSSGGKSFACQPFSVVSLFQLIEQVGKRLENVVIENQDFEVLIKHYDRENSFFYCDPPYFSSEYVYQCGFTWDDHLRLKNALANAKGKWLVSYNDCEEIRNLYDGYLFFDFTRLHNMKQRINAGEQFPELLISNYDMYERQRNKPLQLSLLDLTTEQQIDLEQILKECIINNGK